MKKRIYSPLTACGKYLVLGMLGILFASMASAQLVTYTLNKVDKLNPTAVNPAITASPAIPDASFGSPNFSNTTGIRLKQSASWPGSPAVGFQLDFPFKPVTGNDIKLTGLTFTPSGVDIGNVSPDTLIVRPYYQVDGAGPWIILGDPVKMTSNTTTTPVNVTNVNDVFYSGHSYTVRFYLYSNTGATKSDYAYFLNVVFNGSIVTPPATAPSVTTISATATGKYTATIKGNYDDVGNNFYLVTQSGTIWSTDPTKVKDITLATKTINGANATGIINDNITGLIAGTQYYAVDYIITQFGIKYSTVVLPFKTDAPSVPLVSIALNSVLSNKVNVTSNVTDSGGKVISEKGFVWNKTGGATIASNTGKAYEGSGTQTFTDFVKGLTPNTHYCVRSYATNSIGTGYSADTCFTTGPPVPVLTAIPGNIDFGVNYYGGSALILSYTLTGSNLAPAAGNITVTAPAGFVISSTAGGVFGGSLTIPYTNGTLNPVPVYVKLPTTAYGVFSGNITHSGGGVAAADADIVTLTGSVIQSPIDVSNTGTDFWLGFGYEQKMISKSTAAYNAANLSVYIAGAPNTSVTVEMPLLTAGFAPVTVTIPASGFTQVGGLGSPYQFPEGDIGDQFNAAGLPDARLYYTGVTNRGIHVYSHSGPIAVWLYDYALNNSAGGSMIFPTNTWNSNYTVQAYGGTTNTGIPNSFFFVIANQDNTPVYFTPVANVLDSSAASIFTDNNNNIGNIKYPAGKTDTVYLNRGQVFNAMGAISGTGSSGLGLDLSGTVVRTDCDKKIAVFAGNGRCLVTTPVQCSSPSQGSDNLIQQMIPSVAWDTKYYTVPTKTMEHNLYRIYAHNSATQVWVNDTSKTKAANKLGTITGSQTYNATGGYWTYETSAPTLFESDQPISITQFITAGDCAKSNGAANGDNGQGDPEMIIITGAQQAITNATVYSPNFKDGGPGGGYINVIIPHSGISTFRLDNSALVDTGSTSFGGTPYTSATGGTVPKNTIAIANAFKPYAADTSYYWAKFFVAYPAVHTLSSPIPFNAIAYGVGNGESYGFNAGTAVKNLSSVQFTDNPNGKDSSATAVRTCIGNAVKLKIALPFNPFLVDSIVWNPQGDPRITPNNSQKGAMKGSIAQYDDSIKVNGRTFYVYTSPVAYTFNQLGTYRFPVTAYGTFASDCPGQDIENMLIIVGHDQANLAYTASCGNPTVIFTADTIPTAGTNIIKTIFDFGDGSTPKVNGNIDTSHTYPSNQVYTAKFTSYNSVGCISTDSIQVDFSGGLKAAFTKSTNAVCAGNSITYTDNSTASGISGHPNKWIWSFGDGSAKDSTSGTTVTHLYSKAGKYNDTLTVRTDAGCIDISIDSVTIEATPVAAFTATEACFGSATVFTDNSSVPNNLGTVDSSFFDFGDGTKHDSLTTATLKHIYTTAGVYKAYLYVNSDGGCKSLLDSATVTVDALPTAGFKLDVDCAKQLVTFTDTSNANGGTIKKWHWSLGDGTDTVTTTPALSFKHPYINGNGKSFTTTLTVENQNGCFSDTVKQTFGIGAAPIAQFSIAPGNLCLPNAQVTFVNTSVPNDGLTPVSPLSYIWHFDDGTADSIVAAGQPAPATVHTYTAVNTYNVSLTAISNLGCTNTFVLPLNTIHPQPIASISPNPASTCLNDSLQLSGSAAAQYNWNFGDGVGTNTTDQKPKYKWNTPGKYDVSLVVTSSFGCTSDSAFDSVTVNALPVAAFTVQNIGLCATSAISFTDASTAPANAPVTAWHWDFGDGTAAVTSFNPTHVYASSGTYKVKYWVSNGCTSNTDSATSVTINPLPNTNFSTAPICLPNAAQFTDLSTVAGGTIDEDTWDFGDGSGTTGAPTSHTYLAGGVYHVKLTATSNSGCSHDTTIDVTANNIPTALDSIINDTALCSSKPITLINQSFVQGGSITKVNIMWDYLNPGIDTTDNTPSANGRYTHQYPVLPTDNTYGVILSAYSGNGCPPASPDTTFITVHGSPNAQFTSLAPVCQETAPFVLNQGSDLNGLTGIGTYSGPGVTGDTTNTFTFNPAAAGPGGPYQVIYTFTSANNCSDTASQNISVYRTPAVDYGGTQSVLEGDSATLKAISVSDTGLQFLWTPSLYLNNDTSISPIVKPVNDITYNILVTSPGGCHATATLLVQVLRNFVVPNTFTPNNDGINDVWVIENLPKYPIQWVQIFDRYGQMLFESHGYNHPWDGTYKGKPLPSGTYYYIIEVNGLQDPKTGYVTILR